MIVGGQTEARAQLSSTIIDYRTVWPRLLIIIDVTLIHVIQFFIYMTAIGK